MSDSSEHDSGYAALRASAPVPVVALRRARCVRDGRMCGGMSLKRLFSSPPSPTASAQDSTQTSATTSPRTAPPTPPKRYLAPLRYTALPLPPDPLSQPPPLPFLPMPKPRRSNPSAAAHPPTSTHSPSTPATPSRPPLPTPPIPTPTPSTPLSKEATKDAITSAIRSAPADATPPSRHPPTPRSRRREDRHLRGAVRRYPRPHPPSPPRQRQRPPIQGAGARAAGGQAGGGRGGGEAGGGAGGGGAEAGGSVLRAAGGPTRCDTHRPQVGATAGRAGGWRGGIEVVSLSDSEGAECGSRRGRGRCIQWRERCRRCCHVACAGIPGCAARLPAARPGQCEQEGEAEAEDGSEGRRANPASFCHASIRLIPQRFLGLASASRCIRPVLRTIHRPCHLGTRDSRGRESVARW